MCVVLGSAWFVYGRMTFQPKGEVAFECYPSICIVDVKTGWITKITTDSQLAESPTWSPDGRYLAFLVLDFNGGYHTIQIHDRLLNVTNVFWSGNGKASLRRIVWSPDGLHVLLEAKLSELEGLYLIDAEGAMAVSEPQLLVEKGNVPLYRSAFSADGKNIYFYDRVKANPSESKMYQINTDGTGKQELNIKCPDIAVGPKMGVILCGKDHKYFVLDRAQWNSGIEIELKFNWAISLSGFYNPSWSSDGQYIVYSQTFWPGFLGDHNGELWIMNSDGSHPVKLTNGPADRNPAWRPQP
jgi:Tol biopolymer transport system component